MATQPIIISDDGSPPPMKRAHQMATTHTGEPMCELKSNNGRHPIKGSSGITGVTITQDGHKGDSISVANSVVVSGDKGTKITVEKDSSNAVAVSTNNPLSEDCSSGDCHYTANDTKIIEVAIDGDPNKTVKPSGKAVRVHVDV